jgi:hypothetical protein
VSLAYEGKVLLLDRTEEGRTNMGKASISRVFVLVKLVGEASSIGREREKARFYRWDMPQCPSSSWIRVYCLLIGEKNGSFRLSICHSLLKKCNAQTCKGRKEAYLSTSELDRSAQLSLVSLIDSIKLSS